MGGLSAHDVPEREQAPAPADTAAGSAASSQGPTGRSILVHEGPRHEAVDLATAHLAAPDRPLVVQRADQVLIGPDAVGEAIGLLRRAVFVRVKTLKKVFEGEVVAAEAIPPGPSPQSLEVTLRTDEDTRTLRLDGAFARAFLAAGVRTGEIVQIDPDDLIVVRRPDREAAEGRVHEERDLVYRRPLAAYDEEEAPHRGTVLGTGRPPTVDEDARRAADLRIRSLLDGRTARLEPGILLLTDAEVLPQAVLALIAEAAGADTAPRIVLQSKDTETVDRWLARFEDVARLDASGAGPGSG